MATQVQFRGGTTTEHSSFNGAAREVTVDTTKQTLVVQDGTTNGGFPLLREKNPDNAKAIFGGSDDLQIFHNSTGDLSTIYQSHDNGLAIRSNVHLFQNAAGDHDYIGTANEQGVTLYFDNSPKFATNSSGAKTTGISEVTEKVLVGHSSSVDQHGVIQSHTTTHDTFAGYKYGYNNAPNIIRIGKSRNASIGSNTILQHNDEIGRINFSGADGTDFRDCASIHCFVDETPSTGTDMPGRLEFRTSANATSTPVTRLKIDNLGYAKQTYASGGNGNVGLTLDTNDGTKASSLMFSAGGEYRAQLQVQRVAGDGGYVALQVARSDNSNSLVNVFTSTPSTSGDTTPDLTLGGNLKVADGHGVMFHPYDETATNHGSDSNLLHDYEEGTFHPAVTFPTNNDHTYTTDRVGHYTKVGNLVSGTINITFDVQASSGGMSISLPFTTHASSTARSSGLVIYADGLDVTEGGSTQVYGYGMYDTDQMELYFTGGVNNSDAGQSAVKLTGAMCSGSTTLRISFTQRTAT